MRSWPLYGQKQESVLAMAVASFSSWEQLVEALTSNFPSRHLQMAGSVQELQVASKQEVSA